MIRKRMWRKRNYINSRSKKMSRGRSVNKRKKLRKRRGGRGRSRSSRKINIRNNRRRKDRSKRSKKGSRSKRRQFFLWSLLCHANLKYLTTWLTWPSEQSSMCVFDKVQINFIIAGLPLADTTSSTLTLIYCIVTWSIMLLSPRIQVINTTFKHNQCFKQIFMTLLVFNNYIFFLSHLLLSRWLSTRHGWHQPFLRSLSFSLRATRGGHRSMKLTAATKATHWKQKPSDTRLCLQPSL